MRARRAPRLQRGSGRRKHNWKLASHYSQVAGTELVFDRRRPGKGYRHLLSKRDIERFLALLPEWDELSKGLDAIVLAPAEPGTYGYYEEGVVAICAWPRQLEKVVSAESYAEDREFIERLGVATERVADGVLVRWTESAARAFQLLDVLLHELGHHHDRMTTSDRAHVARGEPYAQRYAREHGDFIWDAYLAEFGLSA